MSVRWRTYEQNNGECGLAQVLIAAQDQKAGVGVIYSEAVGKVPDDLPMAKQTHPR